MGSLGRSRKVEKSLFHSNTKKSASTKKEYKFCIDAQAIWAYNMHIQKYPLEELNDVVLKGYGAMYDIQYYKEIFDRYGGIMRTTQLAREKTCGI